MFCREFRRPGNSRGVRAGLFLSHVRDFGVTVPTNPFSRCIREDAKNRVFRHVTMPGTGWPGSQRAPQWALATSQHAQAQISVQLNQLVF